MCGAIFVEKCRAPVVFLCCSIPDDHQKSIQEYFRSSLSLDEELVHGGNPSLPHLKKLTMNICKHLNRYALS